MKLSLIKMVFRKYRKIMISMGLIAAFAIGMVNGMYNAWKSLDVSLSSFIREYGIADAVVSTDITDTDAAEKIRQVEGVDRIAARLTGSSQIITSSGEILTAQIISMDNEDILRMYRWESNEPQSENYVLADYWFADSNGISAGDVIRIRTGEDEYREFTVAALVSTPETLEKSKLNTGAKVYPDYGFLYAPISLLETETEKETARMTAEWKEKEGEYLQAESDLQETWEEGQTELTKAREELEKRETEFEEKRTELQTQISQLTKGRVQLMLGRKELEDAETTAEERKTELNQLLERTGEQLLEMEDRQAELTEIRNDLTSLLVRLEDARGRLGVSRNQIASRTGELQNTLKYMQSARTIWQQLRSGTEVQLPEIISAQTKETGAEMEAKLAAQGITPENLDSWITQAENGIGQLQNGQARIQKGIGQIDREYMPEVLTYLEETEQGLETSARVRDALRKAITQAEEGLKAIADFEKEAPDNKEAIEQMLKEVEDGITAIYSGLAEGKTALTEGRTELEGKSTEAEQAHTQAQEELAEGAKSLQEAWDELTAWKGYTPLRNEFLIWFGPDVEDRGAVLRAIEGIPDLSVQSSVLYDDSNVADIINDNLVPLKAMTTLAPLFFVGVMMAVLFLLLAIMIRQSRQSIGILRALGFRNTEVRHAFSMAIAILMLVAAVLGAGISFPITRIFEKTFRRLYNLPVYTNIFDGWIFTISTAAFVLLGLVAVAMTSGAIGRIHPAEAASRPVPASPKVGRLSRILMKRMKPITKYCLLSLRRNPIRYIASVICIAGAVSVVFGAFCFLLSKNAVLDEVFGQQIRYDAQIIFSDEPEEETAEAVNTLESITAAERYWAREEDIRFGEKSIRGSLMFLETGTRMISLNDREGKQMDYPEEGIVLSGSVADFLGVKPGDVVTVGKTEVSVAGISRQMAMECQFLPAAEVSRFRKPDYTGWLVQLRDPTDAREITDRLNREPGYATTLRRSVMLAGFEDLFVQFDLYTRVLAVLFSVVGVLIVISTVQNNLQEQKLSLSVLRAIGFQHRQISVHWFVQSLLFMLPSLLIGFIGGKWLAIHGLELMNNSFRHLEYIPSSYQYIVTTVCTVAFVVIGHMISVRTMKKWDLVENTRGRE